MLRHILYKNCSARVGSDVEWVEIWELDFFFFAVCLKENYLKSDNTIYLNDGLVKRFFDKFYIKK